MSFKSGFLPENIRKIGPQVVNHQLPKGLKLLIQAGRATKEGNDEKALEAVEECISLARKKSHSKDNPHKLQEEAIKAFADINRVRNLFLTKKSVIVAKVFKKEELSLGVNYRIEFVLEKLKVDYQDKKFVLEKAQEVQNTLSESRDLSLCFDGLQELKSEIKILELFIKKHSDHNLKGIADLPKYFDHATYNDRNLDEWERDIKAELVSLKEKPAKKIESRSEPLNSTPTLKTLHLQKTLVITPTNPVPELHASQEQLVSETNGLAVPENHKVYKEPKHLNDVEISELILKTYKSVIQYPFHNYQDFLKQLLTELNKHRAFRELNLDEDKLGILLKEKIELDKTYFDVISAYKELRKVKGDITQQKLADKIRIELPILNNVLEKMNDLEIYNIDIDFRLPSNHSGESTSNSNGKSLTIAKIDVPLFNIIEIDYKKKAPSSRFVSIRYTNIKGNPKEGDAWHDTYNMFRKNNTIDVILETDDGKKIDRRISSAECRGLLEKLIKDGKVIIVLEQE